MTSGLYAAVTSAMAVVFVEALRKYYPSRETWRRFRRARGRWATRMMRERFEAAAHHRTSRGLVLVLLAIVIVWIAASSLLDKRWYEVLFDVSPYVVVGAALLRTPGALRAVADRMREYERSVGEDPDSDLDPGPDSVAL